LLQARDLSLTLGRGMMGFLRRTTLALVASAFSLALNPHPLLAQTINWIEYRPADNSYLVQFPNQPPKASDIPLKDAGGTPSGMVSHQVISQVSPDLALTVAFVQLQRLTLQETALSNALQFALSNGTTELRPAENITVKGMPGRHAWMAIAGGKYYAETLIVCSPTRLFSVSAVYSPGLEGSAEAHSVMQHFLSSFSVTEQKEQTRG
jgi:hypothetical protein